MPGSPRGGPDGCAIGRAEGGSPTGAFFFDIHASEPWVAETPAGKTIVGTMFPGSEHPISYHIITHGSCWATLGSEAPRRLVAGDIIVLPHGDAHVLASEPALRRKPSMALYRTPPDGKLPATIFMGAGESAHLVCGFLGCDERPFNPLLTALPRVFQVHAAPRGALDSYMKFALRECAEPRVGGGSVLSA